MCYQIFHEINVKNFVQIIKKDVLALSKKASHLKKLTQTTFFIYF